MTSFLGRANCPIMSPRQSASTNGRLDDQSRKRARVIKVHQNHIETEKLISSLLNACHQPGGKNSKSPGSSVADIAAGTTSFQNSGKSSPGENTSMREVLLMFAPGLCDACEGYVFIELAGGASHTVFRPTT